MTHRPSASSGRRRALVPARRPAGLTMMAALGTVVTLILGVVTVSTLPGGPGERAGTHTASRSHRSAPPGPPGNGRRQGSPGAAGSRPTSTRDISRYDRGSESGEAPHKVLKLADHPLLTDPGAGMRPAGCELPPWRNNLSAAKAFFTAAQQCLNQAWGPVLRRHNLPFHPPELHFPTGTSFRTDCGTIEIGVATAAYYCENDLYVPFAGLQTEQYGQSPGIYLALFAHEYGHHVQELSGIMDAAWQRIYRAGRQTPEGLEMARRKELQAQCFSGMFMATHIGRGGAITQRMFSNAWTDQASRGDDNAGTRNHGSNAHYAKWWRTGARTNRLSACNTFSAPSTAVS